MHFSLAFVHGGTTQHSLTLLDTAVKDSDYMGFWGKKKKTPSGACATLCHANFILACRTKFLILFDMIRSMIRDPIRDPIHGLIRDLVRNAIRSDPSDD